MRYQGRIDPARLVFIDETWAKTNMTRTAWLARRGATACSPTCRTAIGARMTFLAALRHDRIDGALRHRRADQRRKLPRLRRAVPGADAAARRHRHHGQSGLAQGPRVSAASSAPPAHTLFFLPPYSPDLNPIEQVFAKLKALLRKAERTHHRSDLAHASAACSSASPRPNAPATSATQDMLRPNAETL